MLCWTNALTLDDWGRPHTQCCELDILILFGWPLAVVSINFKAPMYSSRAAGAAAPCEAPGADQPAVPPVVTACSVTPRITPPDHNYTPANYTSRKRNTSLFFPIYFALLLWFILVFVIVVSYLFKYFSQQAIMVLSELCWKLSLSRWKFHNGNYIYVLRLWIWMTKWRSI